MLLPALDPESSVSTNSTTWACSSRGTTSRSGCQAKPLRWPSGGASTATRHRTWKNRSASKGALAPCGADFHLFLTTSLHWSIAPRE